MIKKTSRWKTIAAIPVFGLACAFSGHYARDVKNYSDWRKQNIGSFQKVRQTGLLNTITRELNALSAYRHRNENTGNPEYDKEVIIDQETEQNKESELEKEARLNLYKI